MRRCTRAAAAVIPLLLVLLATVDGSSDQQHEVKVEGGASLLASKLRDGGALLVKQESEARLMAKARRSHDDDKDDGKDDEDDEEYSTNDWWDCRCDTTWGCDLRNNGEICDCDWECENVCSCDETWSCDKASSGRGDCDCDPECKDDDHDDGSGSGPGSASGSGQGGGDGRPLWLTEVAASGRFNDPRCTESRSMFELGIERRRDKNFYVQGGLGPLRRVHNFGSWLCIYDHPCLQAVGASHDDRMCYVAEKRNATDVVLHAWGLDSELNLVSQSCTSRNDVKQRW